MIRKVLDFDDVDAGEASGSTLGAGGQSGGATDAGGERELAQWKTKAAKVLEDLDPVRALRAREYVPRVTLAPPSDPKVLVASVAGQQEAAYEVTLATGRKKPTCGCADFQKAKTKVCKHIGALCIVVTEAVF